MLRFFEWYLISSTHSISNNYLNWQINGLFYDFFQLAVLLTIVIIIFILLKIISLKLAKIVSVLIIICVLIFQTLLVFYFKEALTPLSVDDVYGMTNAQVELLIEIYGFKTIYLLIIIPVVAVVAFIYLKLIRLLTHKNYKIITVVLVLGSTLFFLIKPLKKSNYDSEIQYQTIVNKTTYFALTYFNYNINDYEYLPGEIESILNTYYTLHKIKKIKDYKYPFFNNQPLKDVLSPFFTTSTKPPNIVFIISESLGKQYSGVNPNLTSFTPFLDSLANYSLYWENMIANAERTFGAIPNLMAGVIEGPKGFLNLRWQMPDHLSLPLLLKEQNNYQTGFYCGAWKTYDHMSEYLMFQKFDHILGQADFDKNEIKGEIQRKGSKKEFNWGAEDLEVFKQSMQYIKNNYDTLPFFNLYLSTSFHEPYAYKQQKQFINKAKNWIKQKVKPNEQELYKVRLKSFAAIMYADYSMQQLFNMYKKAGLYNNTIFVIVGDHSLKFMNNNPRLEKYHVPLLIHSPLLKRYKNSKSIVCQKDIPSALQALLKNKFGLKMPSFSISQTNQLDTNKNMSFNNTEFVLMYANKRINNYIINDYFISDNILFKIKKGLKIYRENNDEKLTELTSKMKNYKQIINYISNENRYIPKSEFVKFSSINYELDYFNNFTKKDEGIFKDYNLSYKTFFSAPSSLKNNKIKNFTLLNQNVKNEKRIRIVIKYKIKSPSNYYPNLVLVTSKNGKNVKTKTKPIKASNNNIKQSIKQGWKTVQTGFWIEKNTIDNVLLYLFNHDTKLFYIDDLEIKIRAF